MAVRFATVLAGAATVVQPVTQTRVVDVFDIEKLLTERYRSYVDGAKVRLSALFRERADDVFYERQLQVFFEDGLFHWVTSKALKELVEERRINTELVPLGYEPESAGSALPGDWTVGATVRFFWSLKKRYWKRESVEILKLIREYSEPELTRSYGLQAEMLFDAALPKSGFIPVAEHTAEYRGKRWTASDHNLDRIFERDGIAYGVEVKNRLRYIDPKVLRIKLDMCAFLGLKPLFIARMMPKIYNYEIIAKRGGFALIFKYQLYPFHLGGFARKLRDRLGLPIDCPGAIEKGTTQRFLDWHLRESKK